MARSYTTLEISLGIVCLVLLYTIYSIVLRKNKIKAHQRIILQAPIQGVAPYWVAYGDPNWGTPGGTNIRPPRTTRVGYNGVASGGFGFSSGHGGGGHD